MTEYVVGVDWVTTVHKQNAYWETGLFASQHTACKLRNSFTIEKLTRYFGLDE